MHGVPLKQRHGTACVVLDCLPCRSQDQAGCYREQVRNRHDRSTNGGEASINHDKLYSALLNITMSGHCLMISVLFTYSSVTKSSPVVEFNRPRPNAR